MKLYSKIKLALWSTLPVILGILVVSFIFSAESPILKNIGSQNYGAGIFNIFSREQAPSRYFLINNRKELQVSADAYTIGDLDTGEIILSKNQEEKFPIASVSKLMTATVSTELQNQDNAVQISKKILKTEGQNGNLRLNEKIKVGDLLHALLLESSNDAAEAIALDFGREIFISEMNEKAKDLGLVSTSFEDPSGLSPNNQSTTFDLFKFAKYIKENKPDLFKITQEKSYKNSKHIWLSNNQFLKKDAYEGGKSGYTSKAKQTVISLFILPLGESEYRRVAITLLHSDDRYKDVEDILRYLRNNVYYGQENDVGSKWVKAKVDRKESENLNSVYFAFAGDIMLDRGVRSSVMRNFGGDYSKFLDKLEILKSFDIVFANLEGPASDKGKDKRNLYSFRMDPTVIPALAGTGVNVLSVANNHAGDWGLQAFIDTLSRLKENEILYTGGGFNEEEAVTPAIIKKSGMKIGFLGFSDVGPNMPAGNETAGLLLANNPRLEEIIASASNQVDYLIVSFHFGDEYKTKHNKRQEELAHKAIDNGAKLVIGSHPHVPQDTEVYSPKDCTQSSCTGYIAYSLGNFIFDQSWSKPTMQGMLLEVKLNRNGEMTVRKNTVKLNPSFQPNTIIKGIEEKIKFQEVKTIPTP